MDYKVREEGDYLVVAFSGDIDLKTSPDARAALLDAVEQRRDLLVDLSQVSYIDSSGIASLVESFQNARKRSQGYILVSVSDSAKRVLELARLDKVFTIAASVDEAIARNS